MDNYIFRLSMRQIKRWYPNKSTKWRVKKHFKVSEHPGHNDRWTFTDPKTGSQVDKMSWININIINALNIGLHLMTLNMMNTSINAC